jgi:hypothetical protein
MKKYKVETTEKLVRDFLSKNRGRVHNYHISGSFDKDTITFEFDCDDLSQHELDKYFFKYNPVFTGVL